MTWDRRDATGRLVPERLGQGASASLSPIARAIGIAVIPPDLPSVLPGQPLRVEVLCE